MKRLLFALALMLQAPLAWAGCSVGALPFQLQDNTVADATQVMANLNQITTGTSTNCAAAGANNDITSLGALSTPISTAQGGTPIFVGGASSGVNTVTVASTTPVFSLVAGNHVIFTAGSTNTAQATLQIASTAQQQLFRRTSNGPQLTQGGELILNNTYDALYTGSAFIIVNDFVIIGEMRDFAGSTAPPGWLFADGTIYNQSLFPQLFAIIGQAYGGGAGTFAVPDTRGRTLVGLDNFGSAIGAANRLTSAATGCGTAMTVPGAACVNGLQNHVQLAAEIATHTPTFNDPGHTHALSQNQIVNSGSAVNVYTAGGGGTSTTVTATNSTTGITMNSIGSSQAMPIVNPNLGVVKIIRF